MKKLLITISTLILLTSAVALAKPSDFDNEGDISATVSDSGFNADGWNYNAHLFSGRFCDFINSASCDDHLIYKWSSNFDLTKSCTGETSDNQAEGAWFMQIVRRADNSVDRGKVECGSNVANTTPYHNEAGCNCYTVVPWN